MIIYILTLKKPNYEIPKIIFCSSKKGNILQKISESFRDFYLTHDFKYKNKSSQEILEILTFDF